MTSAGVYQGLSKPSATRRDLSKMHGKRTGREGARYPCTPELLVQEELQRRGGWAQPASPGTYLLSARSVLLPTSMMITSLPLSVLTSSIHLEVCWKELRSGGGKGDKTGSEMPPPGEGKGRKGQQAHQTPGGLEHSRTCGAAAPGPWRAPGIAESPSGGENLPRLEGDSVMICYVDQWEPGEGRGCQLTKPQLLGQACPGTSVFSHLDPQAQKLLCMGSFWQPGPTRVQRAWEQGQPAQP